MAVVHASERVLPIITGSVVVALAVGTAATNRLEVGRRCVASTISAVAIRHTSVGRLSRPDITHAIIITAGTIVRATRGRLANLTGTVIVATSATRSAAKVAYARVDTTKHTAICKACMNYIFSFCGIRCATCPVRAEGRALVAAFDIEKAAGPGAGLAEIAAAVDAIAASVITNCRPRPGLSGEKEELRTPGGRPLTCCTTDPGFRGHLEATRADVPPGSTQVGHVAASAERIVRVIASAPEAGRLPRRRRADSFYRKSPRATCDVRVFATINKPFALSIGAAG